MTKEEIVDYIRQYRGYYPLFKLRQLLIQRGYSPNDIDEAISEIYHPEIRKPKKKTKHNLLLIILAVVFIIFLAIILFLIFKPKEPKQLLDLKIISIENEVEKGQNLNFEVEALNLGKEERYDITLIYDIFNLQNQYYPNLRKEETVALQDKSVFPNSIMINLKPGTYKLKVKAVYNNQVASASKTFEVTGEIGEETEEAIEEQEETTTPTTLQTPETCEDLDCNDNNQCTTDSCENNLCKHETILECCGNNICEENKGENNIKCPNDCVSKVSGDDDKLEQEALQTAGTNPTRAIQLCLSISNQNNADYCLDEAARQTENSAFCEKISEQNKKDNCYMSLALEGKSELCQKIINGYKKNSCLALT